MQTIHVELLDEGTKVWRPVQARRVGGGIFQIGTDVHPHELDERWAFQPGDHVKCETRDVEGISKLFAVEKV